MNTKKVKKKGKAIALISGGLDSTLAVKLILDQGIDVVAVNFISPFCLCNKKSSHGCRLEALEVSKNLGIQMKILGTGTEYLEIIKNPKHGYGKNMNPCIDCRIYMHKRAKKIMKVLDADFIITGEVLGQRPMSQRKDAINIIDRESGLKGLVLRPLSAKSFPSTIPEQNGLVDRDKLLKITGRSRKPQMELAKHYNIQDYPCSAGGCLLTDPGFARRFKDLLQHKKDIQLKDIQMLKIGRQHRFQSGEKLIVGRNESENNTLLKTNKENNLLMQPIYVQGPVALLQSDSLSNIDQNIIDQAVRILLHYCKVTPSTKAAVKIQSWDQKTIQEVKSIPAFPEEVTRIRL